MKSEEFLLALDHFGQQSAGQTPGKLVPRVSPGVHEKSDEGGGISSLQDFFYSMLISFSHLTLHEHLFLYFPHTPTLTFLMCIFLVGRGDFQFTGFFLLNAHFF